MAAMQRLAFISTLVSRVLRVLASFRLGFSDRTINSLWAAAVHRKSGAVCSSIVMWGPGQANIRDCTPCCYIGMIIHRISQPNFLPPFYLPYCQRGRRLQVEPSFGWGYFRAQLKTRQSASHEYRLYMPCSSTNYKGTEKSMHVRILIAILLI